MNIEQNPTVAPSVPSLDDMDFCHICVPGSKEKVFCGAADAELGAISCDGFYDGEAICANCGNPTCPRCAVLSDLEDRLEDDGS